jgi:hypothetical protein
MDLKQYYNNIDFKGSYGGKDRFYKSLKDIIPDISRKDVEKYLQTDDSYTLHKPVQKPRKFRRIYSRGIRYAFSIDLVDMSHLARKNRGYKWLISCIDMFSRKLYCFKSKNKKGKTITNVLRDFLTREKPRKIETDEGGEFECAPFKALCKRLKIKMYHVYSDRKCSLIERAQKTLKGIMYRRFTATGSHVWWNVIDKLVENYNNSFHRSIQMAPNEVNSSNEARVRATLYPSLPRAKKAKYEVGQTVRITRKRTAFQRGFHHQWSYEIFKIAAVKDTKPKTYELVDFNSEVIKGSFYEQEIQPVDKSSNIYSVERIVRKRRYQGGVQYLVKYLGYPSTFNSWVNQEDLFHLS